MQVKASTGENIITGGYITGKYAVPMYWSSKSLQVRISTQVKMLLLYPQTKVGDILDSGLLRRRRRRRNFLVDAITQKQINIFFSNLVHMLRVPKGRSLF